MAMGMGCPQKKGDYFMKLGKGIGIAVPEILIPDEKTNMRKWAVIACDQFVQNRQYWNDVERFVGSSPSTLHVMLPEIYLDSPDKEERISEAKEIMRSYIEDGVLNLLPPGFILVERYIDGVIRKGLMVNIDLEEYENEPYKTPLVRASEEVIVERIPPRIEIRNGADIEMPHIMLLMDDKDRTVIEPIWQKKEFFPKVYDFELMMGGGRVTGYFINNKEAEQEILRALSALPLRDGMRFCVGDGNHSLATAKAVWEQAKEMLTPEQQQDSPLRYALCELINLYDEGLSIKPIHRVISGLNTSKCVQYIVDRLNASGADARLVFSRRKPILQQSDAAQTIFFSSKDSAGRIEIYSPTSSMIVEELQPVLENFLREFPSCKLEYVHGDEELEGQTRQYDTLGFIMPALEKETFFETLASFGVLPKKSFSLGEAKDKRYYLECRLIARLPKEEEQKSEEAAQAAPEDAKEAVESRPIPKKKGYRIRQEFQEGAQVEELSHPEEE